MKKKKPYDELIDTIIEIEGRKRKPRLVEVSRIELDAYYDGKSIELNAYRKDFTDGGDGNIYKNKSSLINFILNLAGGLSQEDHDSLIRDLEKAMKILKS